MSFSTPTLSQLVTQVSADLDARLPGADSRLRHTVIGAIATAWAFALFGAYGFLGWISRQPLPDTADDDQLDRHASLWGLTRAGEAKAVGAAFITGVHGATIPAGSRLQRNDRVEYETTITSLVSGSSAVLLLRAVLGGKAGNADVNTQLTFTSPVSGVQSIAYLFQAATGGTDRESDTELRARVLERLRHPPLGGAAHDYIRWTKEAVPGVTRVWVDGGLPANATVTVRFVFDDRANIMPLAADVSAVSAYINAPHRRPVTAYVVPAAPTAKLIAMTISVTPNTPEVKAAVTAELTDMLRREAKPGGTILLSHLREAVSAAVGETDNAVTVPTGNVTCAANELAVLGTITWA